MDDGFQNGSLCHDLDLVVVDGGYGFGNGRVIPAGPCREPVAEGLARADAVVLVGDDVAGIAGRVGDTPLLRARLCPGPEAERLCGVKVVAFAGIGRPEKFFATLRQCGADLVGAVPFPDHHPYGRAEIERLLALAAADGAELWTTAKDAVRVPADLRGRVRVLSVALVWDDPAGVDCVLAGMKWP